MALRNAAATCCSCAGLAYACSKQTAIDSTSDRLSVFTSASTDLASSFTSAFKKWKRYVTMPERDHAGFLLSRIDSQLTIDELLDTSGMPRLEALRTISDLLDLKAIEVVRPGPKSPRR